MKKLALLFVLALILAISIDAKSQSKKGVLELGMDLYEYGDSFYEWYNVFKNDEDEIGALCGLLGGSYALCLAIGSTSLYEDNAILKSINEKAELEHYLKEHNIDPQEFYKSVYESKSVIIKKCETYTGTNICKPESKIGPDNGGYHYDYQGNGGNNGNNNIKKGPIDKTKDKRVGGGKYPCYCTNPPTPHSHNKQEDCPCWNK